LIIFLVIGKRSDESHVIANTELEILHFVQNDRQKKDVIGRAVNNPAKFL